MGAQNDRKAARQDVVTRLKAASTVTAKVPTARIYDSRITTVIPVGQLPMLNVYTSETEERRRGAAIFFDVIHKLHIECFETQTPTGDAGADDASLAGKLDDLAEVVQSALMTDPAFLSLYEVIDTIRSEVVLDGSGDGRRGLCRLSFDIKHTAQYDPATPYDLEQIQIDVNLIENGTAPDSDIDAELDITGLDT